MSNNASVYGNIGADNKRMWVDVDEGVDEGVDVDVDMDVEVDVEID